MDESACPDEGSLSLRPEDVLQGPLPFSEHPDHNIAATWPGEPLLAMFLIGLPAPVGIPHGSTFTMERPEPVEWLKHTAHSPASGFTFKTNPKGANFVSLKVWQARQKLTFPTVEMDALLRVLQAVVPPSNSEEQPREPPPDVETFFTVIEAVTPLLQATHGGFQAALSLAFDRALEEVNALVRAHMVTASDYHARYATRHNIHPVTFFTLRQPFGGGWSGPSMFFPSDFPQLFHDPQVYDAPTMKKFSVALSRQKQLDPLATFVEWSRTAHQLFQIDGDHALAVVAAHTAGEVLFDSLLLLMAWEEGTPRAVATDWFEARLAKRLRTHYAPRLGGDWNTATLATVPGRWTLLVSDLRNRAVHAGYRATEADTAQALGVLHEVEQLMKERLLEKRNMYPRTALLLLGRPGLESRGAYSGKIKRFAEDQTANEPPWLVSYRTWLATPPDDVPG